jgi:hypothetical protein
MSTSSQDSLVCRDARKDSMPVELSAAETTLRLIAQLQAPDELERRILAGLHSKPAAGRVLKWPRVPRIDTDWKRAAAAAAIAFAVAGGGWSIYWNVRPTQAGGTAAPQVRP